MSKPSLLRCAIYTRKSTDEGLDQAYNSLHAQRDACEGYIKSQAGEGWKALPAAYDDGGFSGGSMERPALKRLLADIKAGRLDVVVVYKVDRLTRSLTDFSRIVETLDAAGVSFVSVTQAFNTTTSMGRLTLNVLLSFAQFEREVTGERIRDKIAASKAKGMWMGGKPPLGYAASPDPQARTLVAVEAEAEQVRAIFRRYLELGSVHVLQRELEAAGVRSKAHTTAKGKLMGGQVINRGALFHILKNRLYLGEIVHKETTYPGLHEAIVPGDLFDAVQAALAVNTRGSLARPTRTSQAPLTGLIFGAAGEAMSPTFSQGRGGRPHRYYVSAPLQQGRTPKGDALRRLPGGPTDRFVREAVERLSGREFRAALARVEVNADSVHLLLRPEHEGDCEGELSRLLKRLGEDERAWIEPGEPLLLRVALPVRLKFIGGRTWLIGAAMPSPTRRPDRIVVSALKASHRQLAAAGASPSSPPEMLIHARGLPDPFQRASVRLAFLAPDLQEALLAGGLPPTINVTTLTAFDLPLAWADQRTWLQSRA